MMKKKDIGVKVYYCDGGREKCNSSSYCFKNGGKCRLTTDKNHVSEKGQYEKNLEDI